MKEDGLNKGFLEAKKITRGFAKTFYLASVFLPKDKRLASYAVYALCRLSDESVDSMQAHSKKEALNKINKSIETAYSKTPIEDNLLLSFRHTVIKYAIPKEYFDELIEGMRMDLTQASYNNFNELYSYCYRVAGIVGLIMLRILGTREKSAEEFALSLGIAMQITNILRDIKEDFSRGRIYLPLEDLNKFSLSKENIASNKVNDDFIKLMKFEIERCREYYQKSQKGIQMITGPRERFVVIAMKEMYSQILRQIEKQSYDIFSSRAHLNKFQKILAVIKVIMRGEYL
ncbi:MAG: phytoene/squalene synthase family protein [Candidatus Omnitrophica bacterium]|nr:phytoene/squalene synthase family protein [Candidatus Omnitrophota bacterium]MDD3987700.1 phytoene/squalene synthase family protein [Candidatus Omnitrophota bacterium]MDD4981882.1 phytoene/squalene synthase family protein [Candidatus Omnitrophota bacterium]MDD5665113.1 phytoene/squalene synthase family protein [Candidatus Omnitrophota bacterium]